jgi:hypothetical protein
MMVGVIGRVLVVAALAGCGRLGFGPDMPGDDMPALVDAAADDGALIDTSSTACAMAVGHDEDGDGVDDGCDVCPQITDNQLDSDADRVGNSCDLATTQETRMFFDPAIAKRPGWRYDANQTLNGDSITLPGTVGASVVMFAGTPGHTVVEAGGRISATDAGDHQLAIHVGREGSTNYYCELYEAGGSMNAKLTLNNAGVYSNINATPVPGPLTAGSTIRLVFEHAPPNLRCVVWWNGVRYQAATTTAPGVVPLEQIYLAANGIDAEIQYFVQLSTP